MPVSSTRVSIATVITLLFFMCSSVWAQADVLKISPTDNKLTDTDPVANVYFVGNVTQTKIKEFLSTLDEINLKHNKIKKINLYILSRGGDMDSGFAAYWAIKSSPIPITAINLSIVGSAATMLFCASNDRHSIEGGRFILHPAGKAPDNEAKFYKPDELTRMQQELTAYNKMFADIYKNCTTYNETDIAGMLSSEDSRKLVLESEAQAHGLIKGTTNNISRASLVFYITDAPSK